ncbi:MAG: phosphotransferase [Microbacteriaceae bacterium]|nr:phosphotransferase [Microbacteriaceae bacterium]
MSEVLDLLGGWVPQQRWYAGAGEAARLRLVGSFELPAPADSPGVRLISIAFVRDETTDAIYQVPLVIRDVDAALPALGFIAPVREHGDRAALVDGAHDTAFTRALIELIADEAEVGGSEGVRVYGQPMPGARVGEFVTSRVLQGEQSNTSIVCELRGADGEAAAPLIVKLYRRLHAGDNPDVTLQTALAAAGSLRVPPAFGQLAAVWPDGEGLVSGHLAFAEEFFAGVEDAWRVALRAAEGGEDFAPLARSLGEATAEVHQVLRRVMPTVEATTAEVETAVEQMWRRYEIAATEVPELAELGPAIEAVYGRAADARWPELQRIHGDFHLGQVLAVPERGWVLLDFEGEPLRPLDERNAPDAPARDVAGMLRSFDYVAGSLSMQAGREVAREWADASRAAFLDGYAAGMGADAEAVEAAASADADGAGGAGAAGGTGGAGDAGVDAEAADREALLAAYELDKAVYEAIYEARHRPSWLPIPLAAVRRLVAA